MQASTVPSYRDFIPIRILQVDLPHIQWLDYINSILKPYNTVNETEKVWVIRPPYFLKLEQILKSTSKKTLANYVYWRAVEEALNYWNEDIIEQEKQLKKIETEPRSNLCTEFIDEKLPLATGALYVRRIFNATTKKYVAEIIDDLISTFHTTLKNVSLYNLFVNISSRKLSLSPSSRTCNSIQSSINNLNYIKFKGRLVGR